MYTVEFAYALEKLRGILIKKDDEVIHDIFRSRNDNHLFVSDIGKVIFDMEYVNKQLRRVETNEEYLDNKDKVRLVKYNNSGSITISYYGKDVTYDGAKNLIYTTHKIQKKGKSIKQNVTPCGTCNAALNALLYNIATIIDKEQPNYSTSTKDVTLRKELYKEPTSLLFKINKDSTYKTIFEKEIMPAVESLAIFL